MTQFQAVFVIFYHIEWIFVSSVFMYLCSPVSQAQGPVLMAELSCYEEDTLQVHVIPPSYP